MRARKRLAIVAQLAPRKLGSMEQWLLQLGTECHRKGLDVTIAGDLPIHPQILTALEHAGISWVPLVGARGGRSAQLLRTGFDLIHLNLFGLMSRAALTAYMNLGARVVFVDHYSREPAPRHFEKLRLFAPLLNLRLGRFIGVSEYVTRRAVCEYGIASRLAQTIYNGVDLEHFVPVCQRGDSSETIRVLAVANLIPEKGIHLLLDALAQLDRRDVMVDVVGDGPMLPELRRQASSLNLDGQVAFLGLRDDVASLMAKSDVLVHPATWEEAFGLTIAEAMASGIPVVATGIGAIPELVLDGATGLLFPVNSVVGLTSALRRLIDDPALRATMSRAAQERVQQCFSLERCVQEHWQVCDQVLTSR